MSHLLKSKIADRMPAQRIGKMPVPLGFSESNAHLDERLFLQSHREGIAKPFCDSDDPGWQHFQQLFCLHVAGCERVREQDDVIDTQSGALSKRLDLIGVEEKNVAVRVWLELDRFKDGGVSAF